MTSEAMLTDGATAVCTRECFDRLPEYSCSIPTGFVPGKRWKRAKVFTDPTAGWLLGEYGTRKVEGGEEGIIHWRELLVVD